MSDLVRSLRLFLHLSETGNFSTLARQRNMSHSTVARAVDDLEAHFGVRLFHRSTRRLTLTPDGTRLVDHAAAIVEQIDQAEADLAGAGVGADAARGPVRIGVTTALGLHYARALGDLRARHPGLSVEMLVADWRDMADEGGLDLWLMVESQDGGRGSGWDSGRGGGSGRALGELERILVASPAYLDVRGVPEDADALLRHDCLTYGYAARAGDWMIDGRALRPSGFLRANSSEAVLRAVQGGLGIGLLPRIQVADDLARGAMVQLLPGAVVPPVPVAVGYPYRAHRLPMRVRVVLDFLVAHFPVHSAAHQSSAPAPAGRA